MSDTIEEKPSKKKGKLGKMVVLGGGVLALVGGGVGAGLYAASSGLVGGHAAAADDGKPKLVPKSEQKRAGEGDDAGHAAASSETPAADHGRPTPDGHGGDKYASNYYALDKEFTSNLQNSIHMVQVGVAVSTPYDMTVVENLKTNEIAVRSAILMALADTTEEQVFTNPGKVQLQRRIAKAINDTLKEKEGFGGVGNVYFTNFVVQ